jgi:hypothetical protein
LFDWTVELLARELILNAPERGERALVTWNDFAKAGNLIRDIEGKAWSQLPNGADLIHYEIVRIAHRQFPWQIQPNSRLIASYYRLYSNDHLAPLVQKVFGMSARELFQIGVSLSGHFLSEPFLRLPAINQLNAASDAVVTDFLRRFSLPTGALRERMQQAQSYNVNWAYAFDPLRTFPLIEVSADRLFCPMPTLLLWRFTEGVYFDLVQERVAFDRAFGPAFQDLAQDVVRAASIDRRLQVLPEARYGTKARPKDSVDLIVQDETAVLFVECKASRLKAQAKVDINDTAVINGEIDRLAGFVAQLYATLADALDGAYPHWKPDGRPVYPLVLTLDEWLPSGRLLNDAFEEAVRAKLGERGVPLELLEERPFTLCSLQEFEAAAQIMARVGVGPVMAGKTANEQRTWAMSPFLQTAYRAEMNELDNLFADEWDDLMRGPGRHP